MAEAIAWSELLETAGAVSTCNYVIDCIICGHSVPLNSVRRPVVPICSECCKAIRELIAERQAKES